MEQNHKAPFAVKDPNDTVDSNNIIDDLLPNRSRSGVLTERPVGNRRDADGKVVKAREIVRTLNDLRVCPSPPTTCTTLVLKRSQKTKNARHTSDKPSLVEH